MSLGMAMISKGIKTLIAKNFKLGKNKEMMPFVQEPFHKSPEENPTPCFQLSGDLMHHQEMHWVSKLIKSGEVN